MKIFNNFNTILTGKKYILLNKVYPYSDSNNSNFNFPIEYSIKKNKRYTIKYYYFYVKK